jgi:CRP-like cAMP-binding protein
MTSQHITVAGQQNWLVAQLTQASQHHLFAKAEPVHLAAMQQLCASAADYQYLYFPQTAVISLLAKLPGHPPLEMGVLGFEGVLGATLLLHTREVPYDGVVQAEGSALRVPVAAAEKLLQQDKTLRRLLQSYLFSLLHQLASNAICVHYHQVEARLARWLLMIHDRSASDELFFTHQFLAEMLGVRRSSVTVAAGDLQASGIIRYERGRLTVLDRDALQARSCQCYQRVPAHNAR